MNRDQRRESAQRFAAIEDAVVGALKKNLS